MKRILIITALFCSIACDEKPPTSKPDAPEVAAKADKKVKVATKKKSTFEKKEACELITKQHLKSVLGWEGEIYEKLQRSLKKGNQSACFYKNVKNEEAVLVNVGWSSEKAIEYKAIASAFKNALEKGMGKLTYKEVKSASTQTIFGEVELKNGGHTYHLKERFENVFEISIDMTTKETDPKKYEALLRKLMEKGRSK